MKAQYYPETDSLYVDLDDRPSVDSREIGPGVVADFDERGNLVGLDIDRALRNRYVTPEMLLASVSEQIQRIEHGPQTISQSDLVKRLADLRNAVAHARTNHELFAMLLIPSWLETVPSILENSSARRELLEFLREARFKLESLVESELHPEVPSKKRP